MEININELKPHPGNVKIYGVENVDELAAQITASAWVKPLVVTDYYGGYTIVSGHRRHAAGVKLGFDVLPCELVTFTADWQVMERLLLENDSREKTIEQRTREFIERKKVEEAKAKDRMSEGGKGGVQTEEGKEKFPYLGQSRDHAAEQSGLGSGRTATTAEAIVTAMDNFTEQGEQEKADLLKQSLEQKNISGTKAILDFIAKLPKETAAKYAEDLKAGRKTTTQVKKEIEKASKSVEKQELKTPKATGTWKLIQNPIATAELEPESLDFIITDPPYPYEFMPVYSDLATFALRHLKPGGSLIAMVGQSYLPEIMQRLSIEGLNYHWMLSYLTPGAACQLWQRKVNTNWKPLIWFVKGKYEGDWVSDVTKSGGDDKQHHYWGQSESGMADIVSRFTYPEQLICDPFCGGGTTGVVAVQLGRKFIGIDSDPNAIRTSNERLSKI
jgi:ParB-like chromosome segregation protein Spo0J